MEKDKLRKLLTEVQEGTRGVDDAVRIMRHLPFIDIGFAKYDTHRSLRQGFPEVIFGQGKTDTQIVKLCRVARSTGNRVMVTRIGAAAARRVERAIPGFRYHRSARMLTHGKVKEERRGEERNLDRHGRDYRHTRC